MMSDAPISVTITQLILAAIPMTLAALASFVQSVRNHSAAKVAAEKAVEAKEEAIKTTDKIDLITISINGRLSELIEALRQSALLDAASQRAIGHMEGIVKGRELERADRLKP
jgi:hypothetical protein